VRHVGLRVLRQAGRHHIRRGEVLLRLRFESRIGGFFDGEHLAVVVERVINVRVELELRYGALLRLL
jgi:hypothetical protein